MCVATWQAARSLAAVPLQRAAPPAHFAAGAGGDSRWRRRDAGSHRGHSRLGTHEPKPRIRCRIRISLKWRSVRVPAFAVAARERRSCPSHLPSQDSWSSRRSPSRRSSSTSTRSSSVHAARLRALSDIHPRSTWAAGGPGRLSALSTATGTGVRSCASAALDVGRNGVGHEGPEPRRQPDRLPAGDVLSVLRLPSSRHEARRTKNEGGRPSCGWPCTRCACASRYGRRRGAGAAAQRAAHACVCL